MDFVKDYLWFRAKYFLHVSLHIFHDNEHVLKCPCVIWDDDVINLDSVLVIFHLS